MRSPFLVFWTKADNFGQRSDSDLCFRTSYFSTVGIIRHGYEPNSDHFLNRNWKLFRNSWFRANEGKKRTTSNVWSFVLSFLAETPRYINTGIFFSPWWCPKIVWELFVLYPPSSIKRIFMLIISTWKSINSPVHRHSVSKQWLSIIGLVDSQLMQFDC